MKVHCGFLYILLRRIKAPSAELNRTILVRTNIIAASFTNHTKFLIVLLLYLVGNVAQRDNLVIAL